MLWKSQRNDQRRKQDLERRQEALEREIAAAEANGDALAQAIALNNLGTVYADREEWAEALARYEQAAALVPADASLAERATPHGNAANAARRLKDWPLALRHALWVDALGTAEGDAEQQAVAAAAVALVRHAADSDDFETLLREAVAGLPEDLRAHVRVDVHLHPTVERPERPGRNDPCWCGSGRKYKHCHWHEDQAAGR